MTGKEYLSRIQYQMVVVDRLAEKLSAIKTIGTSHINENKISSNHSGNIQRAPESATVLYESYSVQRDKLRAMQMDLIQLTANINDNQIATYLLRRYCNGQSCDQIAKEMNHTVKWLENKSMVVLNDLL